LFAQCLAPININNIDIIINNNIEIMGIVAQTRTLLYQFNMGSWLGGCLSVWVLLKLHLAHLAVLLGLFLTLREHGDTGMAIDTGIVGCWFMVLLVLCLFWRDLPRAPAQLALLAVLYVVLWTGAIVLWGTSAATCQPPARERERAPANSLTRLYVVRHKYDTLTFLTAGIGGWIYIALLILVVIDFALFVGMPSTALLLAWLIHRISSSWSDPSNSTNLELQTVAVGLSLASVIIVVLPFDWLTNLAKSLLFPRSRGDDDDRDTEAESASLLKSIN